MHSHVRLPFAVELVSKNKGYEDPQKPPEDTIVDEAEAFARFTFAVANAALATYQRNPDYWGLSKRFHDLNDQKKR